jgi:hypothetical protein
MLFALRIQFEQFRVDFRPRCFFFQSAAPGDPHQFITLRLDLGPSSIALPVSRYFQDVHFALPFRVNSRHKDSYDSAGCLSTPQPLA